jgi:LPS sulfotransferase NodH
VFGARPRGVWPSEGSVSEEVLSIGHGLGVKWMATDEGVLGRTLNVSFARDGEGRLPSRAAAEKLYNIHHYQSGESEMNLVFRDHTISDLIGFVYSKAPAQEAAEHLIYSIKRAAQPVLDSGRDAVLSVILDGENAWEYYPQSGREFLRRFYNGLQRDPAIEAVTVSEAIERHKTPASLTSLVPGSWINANFNVWIGAPEDNRSWDHLSDARNFYAQASPQCSEEQRQVAFEEVLIAEGSDWNWWYGPEHHSANDREFDELYRKHLSNVYQALGATPPDYLAQPIIGGTTQQAFTPQTAYIHPGITGDQVRYFEWMGAAHYVADRRAGSMHGKTFLLDAVYAGIDETYVYGRLDFAGKAPDTDFELVVNLESWAKEEPRPRKVLRLEAAIRNSTAYAWNLRVPEEDAQIVNSSQEQSDVSVALARSFEFKLPLTLLLASPPSSSSPARVDSAATTKLRLRFSLWENRLPMDALPVEGWVELQLLSEDELKAHGY